MGVGLLLFDLIEGFLCLADRRDHANIHRVWTRRFARAARHLESGAVFLIGRENVFCCCVLIVGGPTLLCRVEQPNEISGWCVLLLTRLYSPNTAMSMGCQIGIPRVSKCIQHYSWPLLVVVVGIGQLGGLLRGGGRKKDSALLNSAVVRKVRGNNVQTTRRNDQDSNKDVLNSTDSSPCKSSFNIPHIWPPLASRTLAPCT